ncbi:MAG: endolytic transglycosylase MltG [Myxococcota bacterium]
MRRILIGLFVLLVLGLGGLFGAWRWVETSAENPIDPSDTEGAEVEIPKGATLQKIGLSLHEKGYVASPFVWKVYLRLHGAPEPKAGRHKLKKSMNLAAILAELAGPPLPDDIAVKIVEGWRIRDTDEALSKEGLFPAGAYAEAAKHKERFKLSFAVPEADLEGYLYPETFAVPRASPINVDLLIQRQLDAFRDRFYVPYQADIEKSGRSLHEVVVMASLLEREETKPEMRPKVAGVLYKRLDAKNPLGVDATSHFSLPNWNDRPGLLRQLKDAEDPYNTRLRAGLPPGAIGAPSLPSLIAALRPESSEFWYYLHDSTGTIHFAKDGAGHEANRKKYNVY